jgi:hypothetical protein
MLWQILTAILVILVVYCVQESCYIFEHMKIDHNDLRTSVIEWINSIVLKR